MPLPLPTAWGAAIRAAIQQVPVSTTVPIDNATLDLIWEKIAEELTDGLNVADVAPGSFSNGGGPVGGVGGPVT